MNTLQKNSNLTAASFQQPSLNIEHATNDILLDFIDEIVIDLSLQVVKINAMCIFYHHLFGNLDQKLFAGVNDINKKVIIDFIDVEMKIQSVFNDAEQ